MPPPPHGQLLRTFLDHLCPIPPTNIPQDDHKSENHFCDLLHHHPLNLLYRCGDYWNQQGGDHPIPAAPYDNQKTRFFLIRGPRNSYNSEVFVRRVLLH